MEYGAYGSAPDGLPEKFGLTDTIGRKPFCEVGVFFIGQPGFLGEGGYQVGALGRAVAVVQLDTVADQTRHALT